MSMAKCGYCEVIFDCDADPEGALEFHPWFSCWSCRDEEDRTAEGRELAMEEIKS